MSNSDFTVTIDPIAAARGLHMVAKIIRLKQGLSARGRRTDQWRQAPPRYHEQAPPRPTATYGQAPGGSRRSRRSGTVNVSRKVEAVEDRQADLEARQAALEARVEALIGLMEKLGA